MALPDFSTSGDLPPGIHQATMVEVIQRFGSDSGKRALVTQRLLHILDVIEEVKEDHDPE